MESPVLSWENCGVGFAPCPPGGERGMIELMEGVEDIPGTALFEGIEWGQWETFPEYIDYLGTKEYTLDIGTQIPHSAVRNYVMGERALRHEDATSEDIEAMKKIVRDGLNAGALGFFDFSHHRTSVNTGGANPWHLCGEGRIAGHRSGDEGS